MLRGGGHKRVGAVILLRRGGLKRVGAVTLLRGRRCHKRVGAVICVDLLKNLYLININLIITRSRMFLNIIKGFWGFGVLGFWGFGGQSKQAAFERERESVLVFLHR